MKDNRRNIDEFFQEELGNLTEMPPASVWESLEKRLDTKKSDKHKGFWWLYLLLATVLMGGTIAAYFNLSENQTTLQTSENKDKSNIESFKIKNSNNLNNSSKIEQLNTEDFSGPSNQTSVNDNIANTTADKNNTQSNTNSTEENKVNHQGSLANDGTSNASSTGLNNSKNGQSKDVASKKGNRVKEGNGNEGEFNQDLTESSGSEKPNKANAKANADNFDSKTSGDKKTAIANSNDSKTKGTNKSLNSQLAPNTKNAFSTGSKDIDKSKSDFLTAVDNKKSVASIPAEKAGSKKPMVAKNPVDKGRGLSAFPEEDEADLLTVEPAKEKDTDFEPEEAAKEKPTSKLLIQSEAIGKLRSINPLAAAPMASKEIDETTDEEGNEIKAGSSGGGGGGASSKQKEKAKKSLNMAIGVKMGYERGMQKLTAGKYVGTIFAEVNLSPKLSFIMQPSLKFGTANREVAGADLDTFINANAVESSQIARLDTLGKPNGFYDYYISQKYDSVSQTSSFQKKFLEIEIPFLFRYKVDKNLSVLAGINFIFGKTLGFSISERTLSSNVQYDTVRNVFDTVKPSIASKFFAQGASGKSNAMSELASPVSPVRFGYTLGLSYVFRERVMVDLIVQQNLSGTSSISNNEVRKIFDQPYVRLSLGYTIFGNKKK